jgi:hypothetical protein
MEWTRLGIPTFAVDVLASREVAFGGSVATDV